MTVRPGSIRGLIGPNGSGKTTLLNSINGLSPVDAGTVALSGRTTDGRADSRARAGIGRTLQTPVLRRWAAAFGLSSVLDATASSLTPRERRLLEVARALATWPKVLLLDEPIAGLTGDEIDELVAVIRRVSAAGIGVILVEHHADPVMSLCDSITALDAGKVVAAGHQEPAGQSAGARADRRLRSGRRPARRGSAGRGPSRCR